MIDVLKRKIAPGLDVKIEPQWKNLGEIAQVEVSSEAHDHPIDDALVTGLENGWISVQSGRQIVRLYFDEPQDLNKIRVVFKESHIQRSQEFVLRWSSDGNRFQDIVRQQYNFNPPSVETEEYDTDLKNVRALELDIVPDISGGCGIASLAELRVA